LATASVAEDAATGTKRHTEGVDGEQRTSFSTRHEVDLFISHAGAGRAWAEWVAWQLTEAGYRVELDVWDWAAGRNFITAMSDALNRCDRVVALLSAAYFDPSRYSAAEYASTVMPIPAWEEGRLVPVRVEDVPAERVPALLRPLVYRDLFGLEQDEARRALLEAVAGPRRPSHMSVFPGTPSKLSKLNVPGPEFPDDVPSERTPASVAGRIFISNRRDDTGWPKTPDDPDDRDCTGTRPWLHLILYGSASVDPLHALERFPATRPARRADFRGSRTGA
jgi:hypothetical protein